MLNKTALLVKEWAEFEVLHPQAELEDFCRYYLITSKSKAKHEGFLGGSVPPGIQQVIPKLLGRIISMFVIYAETALKSDAGSDFTEFLYLNTIHNMSAPRKTDVIYANFNELSSGLLIIQRLNARHLINEQADKQDKRSKRLVLTEAGLAALFRCYKTMAELCQVFFQDMPEDDIRLCIHLLTPVEVRFSCLWQKHKSMDFKHVYKELTGAAGPLIR